MKRTLIVTLLLATLLLMSTVAGAQETISDRATALYRAALEEARWVSDADYGELADACTEGAINGFATISIAAASAAIAELALPAFPTLVVVGVSIGCVVRVAATAVLEPESSLVREGKTLWDRYLGR